MELDELRAFVTVAAERSFSRAAARLYKTQPAISQAVRRLEDQLGERLLDRTTKQARLTAAGSILFEEGRRLLQMADAAAEAVRRHAERARLRLRIGGDDRGAHLLLPAIDSFLKGDSSLAVDFEHLPEPDVVAGVATGSLDLGVVATARIPDGLLQLRIPGAATGCSVIVLRDHRLAASRCVTAEMIGEDRAVVLMDGPGTRDDILAALGQRGTDPAALLGMPGLDSLKRAVAMGLGIGVVPTSAAAAVACQERFAVVPLQGARSAAVTLVYRDAEPATGMTRSFVEAVRRSRRGRLDLVEAEQGPRTAAGF